MLNELELSALWVQGGYQEWQDRIDEMTRAAKVEKERLIWDWRCEISQEEGFRSE